ncbi:2-oxoglutarate dehydrogenase, mitochondrial [Glycine soja]|uniref:2-oxoglutarate dehydrogenase, mitochondrial n=1 Tax=Glycine soja TaxID=3848 RepID=A0A445IU94_GLYSO|nr:2-oxoglutarate dehydrogenase, mitochondrial [Glycine soja]
MADDHPYVIPEMDPILRKQIQECNWQIVNIHREFRKPLIVMPAKNLLRNQNKHSDVEEGIRRLVLCSGKVYYELDEQRTKEDAKDVAVCRVEKLCPFPYDCPTRAQKISNLNMSVTVISVGTNSYAEVVWCQEEPMNMGGYTYILPRLITSMKAVGRGGYEDVKYAGRAPSAATATGFLKVHLNEQAELVQKAIQREPINFPLLRHSIYIVSPE